MFIDWLNVFVIEITDKVRFIVYFVETTVLENFEIFVISIFETVYVQKGNEIE